jgi:hypothetical protein
MVTVEVPVFVTVTLSVIVLPTPMVPKLTVLRFAESVPEVVVFDGVFALVYGVQLESPAIAIRAVSITMKANGLAARLGLD